MELPPWAISSTTAQARSPCPPSSYDAELHAGSDAGEMCENAQATLAELTSHKKWSIQHWLDQKLPGVLVFIVIAAKASGPRFRPSTRLKREGRATSGERLKLSTELERKYTG